MFKAISLALMLIAGTNQLNLQMHQDGNIQLITAIDTTKLSDAQKAADAFFRQKVTNLKDATLTAGQQDGNNFKFQYLKQTAPLTITQVNADRYDESNNKFRLKQTLQTVSGPVQGGRMTKVVKTSATSSIDQAVSDLKWK